MRRGLTLLILAFAAGCGKSNDVDPPQPTPPAIDASKTGVIRGKVLFAGTAPVLKPIQMASECAMHHSGPVTNDEVLVKNGRLQNVFVYVKQGLEKLAFPWPTTPVEIANDKCLYIPRVAGVQMHQPIRYTSHDQTDHNVHGFSSAKEFNFSLRGKNTESTIKLRAQELGARVKCDIHPWMIGYICVAPHPFFQVTGADGSFELKGLPAGEYVIEAWHEKYGTRTATKKLDPNGSVEVELSFSEK